MHENTFNIPPPSRLVPVGEKDHNPPAIIRETIKPLKIGTFNVRSLATVERYIELIYTIQKIEIDILGLAEVRRMGFNIEEHDSYIFCYKGETPGLHGVGFLIKKEHKSRIVNFSAPTERVALLQMSYDDKLLSIIQVYAPTESAKEEEIYTFYETLQKTLDQAGDNFLVIGDFNAKVGQTRNKESPIMGKFGYGNRNERGEKLIQFALENNLSIMNTYFKIRDNRKWTWQSPNGKTKNEIDFILSNQPKNIRNIEVLHGLGFSSDHRLVRATYHFEKEKRSRTMFKSQPKTLKTEEDFALYLKNLDNYVKQLETQVQYKDVDVQALYDKLVNIINMSIPPKPTCSKQDNTSKIISKPTQNLMRRRSELLKTKEKTKELKEELSTLYKTTSKAIKKDYQNYRKRIIENNLLKYRSTKRAHKQLQTQKNWINNLKTNTKETRTRQEILECATEFYRQLYEKKPDLPTNSTLSSTTITAAQEDTVKCNDKDCPHPVDVMEVVKHIQKIKSNKSPGPDGIQNEALKAGVVLLAHPFSHLFSRVLDTGRVPEQWKRSDIVLLYKKGDPKDIANYRPISLLPSTYKLFTSILQSRLSPKIEGFQPIEQAGFRSGFSTIDHIHVMQQVIEKFKEYKRPLYIAFVDYAKAFDTISHHSIWDALKKCHIHEKYINVLKNIYEGNISRVKLEKRGPDIPICRGVRQGDPLSPKLFISVLQHIFDHLNWQREGIEIAGSRLTHLRFADDLALFAENSKQLERMLHTLSEESEKIGLLINKDKTKVMSNSMPVTINLNGEPLEYVNGYIYLGKRVSFDDNQEEEEVDRRVNMSWKKFWSLKEILKGDFPLHLKKTVLDTCILPTLTYGCQTWTYTTKIKTKLVTCQKAMERSLLKLRKMHKIRSNFIRSKTKLIDALHYALKLKWRWAGHLARYREKRWTKMVTKWHGPPGKRKRGRPKKRWISDILSTTGSDWWKKANDRELWNKLEEAYTQRGVPILDM